MLAPSRTWLAGRKDERDWGLCRPMLRMSGYAGGKGDSQDLDSSTCTPVPSGPFPESPQRTLRSPGPPTCKLNDAVLSSSQPRRHRGRTLSGPQSSRPAPSRIRLRVRPSGLSCIPQSRSRGSRRRRVHQKCATRPPSGTKPLSPYPKRQGAATFMMKLGSEERQTPRLASIFLLSHSLVSESFPVGLGLASEGT